MSQAEFFAARLGEWVDRNLSPEAQSAHLARTAKRELARLQGTGRASQNYVRYVDGKAGMPEEMVRPAPDGLIFYRFAVLGPVAAFALGFLTARSPKGSGDYAKSFYLGISTKDTQLNPAFFPTRITSGKQKGRFTFSTAPAPAPLSGGRFVPMAQFNPQKVTADVAEIVIGNTQPYSRKVDIQIVGGRKLSFSVPPGLFDDCVKAIKARFDDIVEVKRIYTINFPGQYRLKRTQLRKKGRHAGKVGRAAGSPVESPAIVITPRRT